MTACCHLVFGIPLSDSEDFPWMDGGADYAEDVVFDGDDSAWLKSLGHDSANVGIAYGGHYDGWGHYVVYLEGTHVRGDWEFACPVSPDMNWNPCQSDREFLEAFVKKYNLPTDHPKPAWYIMASVT